MTYIHLNMVRAGAVSHPSEWPESGYVELMKTRKHYRISDTGAVLPLFGASDLEASRKVYAGCSSRRSAMRRAGVMRRVGEPGGSRESVERVKAELSVSVRYRKIEAQGEGYALKDEQGLTALFSGLNYRSKPSL